MKIQVIGSGSMWNQYNSACYLIDDKIMIDFPNGACKYLYRANILPSNIEYILFTHFHGDHYFDIPFYILSKAKSESKKTTIFCFEEGKSKIDQIGKLAFPNSYEGAKNSLDLTFEHKNQFKIENYNIEKILVDHGRMKPAYGYIFNFNNTYIGFTGDTALCDNVEIMAQKCSYLFCDCMFIEGTDKHMGIDNLKYLHEKHPNCKFIVSHLENQTREELKKQNIKNIIIPDDGYILEI